MNKKQVKIFGNIVAIIAVVFVIKKIFSMGIDFNVFKTLNIRIAFCVLIVSVSITLLGNSYPWRNFVSFLSAKKIKLREVVPIYLVSNLYKYIPGNIFQYVGRNRLAVEKNISHIDVACATVADVFCSLTFSILFALILIGNNLARIIDEYGQYFIISALIVSSLFIIAIVILKDKKICADYINRYIASFKRNNMHLLVKAFLYYIAISIFSIFANFLALYLIIGGDTTLDNLIKYTGLYSISYIIGFITPGAPGGVGVREAVMLLFCGPQYENQILIYILVQRVAGVFSDIIGGLIGFAMQHINCLCKKI